MQLDTAALAQACKDSSSCRVLYLSQHADHDPLVTVGRCMAEAPGDERHCAELVLERWFQKGPGPSEVQALLVGATTARMQVGYWAGRAAACLGEPELCPSGSEVGKGCADGIVDQQKQSGGCPAH